jgi:hypothetical protein
MAQGTGARKLGPMDPWDDAEVDSDGDELLDWLWDLPDRYDVGYEDDQQGTATGGEAVAAAGVRKHARRPADNQSNAQGGWWSGQADEPTVALDPYDDERQSPVPVLALSGGRRGPSRFNARDLAAAAAVFLVVTGAIALGYSLLRGSNKPKSPNLVIANATTTQPTSFDQSVIPPLASIPPVDTTTTDGSTTTVSSVPAVVVGGTTSTTRRATTTTKPRTTTTTAASTTTSNSTSTSVPTSTTTTVAGTTTTVGGSGSTTSTTKVTLPGSSTT